MTSDEETGPKTADGIEDELLGRKSRNLSLIADLLGISVESLYASAKESAWNCPDASEIAEILKCFTSIKDPDKRRKALEAAQKIALAEESYR